MIKDALDKYYIIKPYLEQESNLSAIAANSGVAGSVANRNVA
jgi:hypothetical protein